jgi:hypothetical protein
MAVDQQPATTSQGPFLKGSILWQKKGPLPVWAWLGIGLLLVVVFMVWRRNRAAGEATEAATGYEQLPGDQTAPPVFVMPQPPNPIVTVTVPTAPPGTGRPDAPKVPPKQPAPIPPGPKPAPPGGFVSVTKYPDRSAPRESTLWDIAQSWLPAGGNSWATVWNHPLSADVRRKRGKPERIQQGDRLFVPGKLAKPRQW